MEQRVQKIISQAGLTSRRKAEELIKEGRVKVDGKVIYIGDKADPVKQEILVDGKKISIQEKIYIMLNKPVGVLSATIDQRGRKTVVDLVKVKQKVFLVGRLDLDASGLIILTNDGDFADRIMHPSNLIQKAYEIRVDQPLKTKDLNKLKNGVMVDGRKVEVSEADRLSKTRLSLTIHEGRKHIVKRLLDEIGYEVIQLKRTAIGPLNLDVKEGQWRMLTEKEIADLSSA